MIFFYARKGRRIVSKLNISQLPFNEDTTEHEESALDLSALDKQALINTALQCFPETWKDEAFNLVWQNKEVFSRYGISIPKSADNDPDFDVAEILTMQIVCNRYALDSIRRDLENHSEVIIERLIELPIMKMRIQNGEFDAVADEMDYGIAA